ncbi:hypothetical protein [Myxococcus stipitatus]|uniref:hypothetical protein n=1 Tax=Myxococcus stipitatus TaxID=83455 RepID=UPI001185E4F3|nr:hypothetical protein [Myxococcus stipitatus]
METALFSHEPLGDQKVVLHRFGGSYGPAVFLLTAQKNVQKGGISLSFVNRFGMPVHTVELEDIEVTEAPVEAEGLRILVPVSQRAAIQDGDAAWRMEKAQVGGSTRPSSLAEEEKELARMQPSREVSSSKQRFKSRDEELKLHERVLQGEPVSHTEVMQAFLEPIMRSLLRSMKCNLDIAYDSTIDALLSYLKVPERYVPNTGRLSTYLTFIAKHQARARIRSTVKQARREQDFASRADLMVGDSQIPMEVSVEASLLQDRFGMFSAQEKHFLRLMLSGERSTQVLSDALGLPAAPPEELRRVVRRSRDRLMKRMTRLATDADEKSS